MTALFGLFAFTAVAISSIVINSTEDSFEAAEAISQMNAECLEY